MRNPSLSSWALAGRKEEMLYWDSAVMSLLETPHEEPAGPCETWTNTRLDFYILLQKCILFSFARHINNCPLWPWHQRQYSNWFCCWRDSCISCSPHAAAEVWAVPAAHGPPQWLWGMQVEHTGRHYPELLEILPQHQSHTPKLCVAADVMSEVRLWRLPLHPMGRCSWGHCP